MMEYRDIEVCIQNRRYLDAANNWWGTTAVADIEYKIRDSRDFPSRGTVVCEPILTQPVETE